MRIINLYRYARPDGGITVSPVKPENTECTEMYRLVADEGKALTDGVTVTGCTDVATTEGWIEIDAPEEETEEEPET